MLKKFAFVFAALPLTIIASRSLAMPISSPTDGSSLIVRVADGCGPGRYRGPGGACHPFGRGPYPDGDYGPGPGYGFNGCPPGPGAVRGAIAAIRPITDASPAAAGNKKAPNVDGTIQHPAQLLLFEPRRRSRSILTRPSR